MSRLLCKDYLKGTCTNSFCEKWHPPVCLFYKSENGCRFGEKCSYAHRQVEEQPGKWSKKNGDKSAVAMMKKHELYDRTGKPVVCRDISHERCQEIQRQNSESEQIRTVVDRQREQILADCQAEIRKHEFQADYDRKKYTKIE